MGQGNNNFTTNLNMEAIRHLRFSHSLHVGLKGSEKGFKQYFTHEELLFITSILLQVKIRITGRNSF